MVRALRAAVALACVVLVLLVALSTAATLVPDAAVGIRAAALTVFTGIASVTRGTRPAAAGRTGDTLADGDLVSTGPDSKAAVFYPDGSVTRLDSDTTVRVHVDRAPGGGLRADLVQTSGLTWNRVQPLATGARFRISGPNAAVTEVRGTEFGYYVEHDAQGNPVIWIDVWSGIVDVSGATGPTVTATTGQRVTVRVASAPTTPAPIPAGDRQLPFTVFNQALNTIKGTPVAFATGTLAAGRGTAGAAYRASGGKDLQFVLGWPGSTYRLTVRDPAGNVAAQRSDTRPPISVLMPLAAAGTWTTSVENQASVQPEAWWLVIGEA